MFNTKFILKLCVVFMAGAIAVTSVTSSLSGSVPVPTEKQFIIEMHDMANNYIVADEIRNKQVMTEERIDHLIEVLQNVKNPEDYPNQEHLLHILHRWKQGEFLDLASEHNFVWGLLEGTIGFATGVRVEDLPAWSTYK